MSFPLFISKRYVRPGGKSYHSANSMISVVGIALGVMALIIVISVMTGFEDDLKSRILGVDAHIKVVHESGKIGDVEKAESIIEHEKGVTHISPVINVQVMIKSRFGATGAVIKGVDPVLAGLVYEKPDSDSFETLLNAHNDFSHDTTENQNEGGFEARYAKALKPPGIIVGKELAKSLGIMIGDPVYLVLPMGMISPAGHMPSMRKYTLVGLFETGMYEYDSNLGFIHIDDAALMLRMGDKVSGFDIKTDNIYETTDISSKVSEDLKKGLGDGFEIVDWKTQNKNLFFALRLEKTAMFVILTLIVLVAAFNIAGTLIMIVMQKTKDIAILKAIGATDGHIYKIFVLKGMLLGGMGTAAGLFLGVLSCYLLKHYKIVELPGDIYYITTIPVLMTAGDIVIIAISAMVISFLATIYPAHRASKLNPAEQMRHG